MVRVQDDPGLGNLMLRGAIANKPCDRQGIKCAQRSIPAAPLGLQTWFAGDLELACGPPETVVQAAARGADIRTLGNGAQGSIVFVVAGNHLDTPNAVKACLAVMRDFKGKKIDVTVRGTGAAFQCVELLKGAGLSAADVTLVAIGAPNTALPALTNKQVAAVMAFEPMSGCCEVLKACRVVVDPRKGEGPADALAVANAGAVLTVRNDAPQKKPQAVAGFVAPMKETEALMQNRRTATPCSRPRCLATGSRRMRRPCRPLPATCWPVWGLRALKTGTPRPCCTACTSAWRWPAPLPSLSICS